MAATRKKVAKRAAQPRNLTKAEHHKMFLYIGKARVMAQNMAEDKKYTAEVRRTLRSFANKLWALGDAYPWYSLTD